MPGSAYPARLPNLAEGAVVFDWIMLFGVIRRGRSLRL